MFRWPWVSRDLYKCSLESVEHIGAASLARAVNAERRYDDLLEKYHLLANPPAPTPAPAPQPPHQERSLSAEIIRQQAKGDPRLAAYLKGFAKQLKDGGANDEEIAMELTQWYSTEGILS